tara:strand:+ start:816 stop:1481 length:666 start_codon:yes stop_codon:yes gene_type:complete
VSSSQRNCLVAGATGLIGDLLVKELIKSEDHVTAVIRQEKVSENPLLTYKKINYEEKDDFQDLFLNVSDVFICLGTTIKKAGSREAFRKVDVDYCFSIAQAAYEAGVPNLSIVTSIGADSQSNNFYLKCKGEIEEKISALNFRSFSIFRPGLLIGERTEKRLGETLGQIVQPWFIDPLLRGSAKKYRSVKALDLACSLEKFSGLTKGKKIYYFQDFLRSTN